MAPVYSNPPHDSHTFQLDDKKDDQLLNSSRDQRMINLEESQQYDHHQVDHGGSSDLQVSAAYSSNKANKMNDISNQKLLPLRKREVGEGSTSDNGSYSSSAKWMPSKMRLMQKLMNSSSSTTTHIDESVNVMQKLQCHDHQLLHDDNNEVNSFSNCSNSAIRVCSDCNTTTTPLWRSGPRGPKSLCNACGIRKRKARRAMEAAAAAAAAGNGTITATDGSFTKIKLQIKDKKPRTSHVGQYKKQCKSHESDPPPPPHHHHQYQSQRKLCFKDFALSLSNNSALKQVFAQDVEEAAILLMELSCGFIHT